MTEHYSIVMARKPLSEKSIAENVIKWGTGGINIDESRIATDDNLNGGGYSKVFHGRHLEQYSQMPTYCNSEPYFKMISSCIIGLKSYF